MLHYSHSVLDSEKLGTETESLAYGCSVQHAYFATAKARDRHSRAKHGVKQQQAFSRKLMACARFAKQDTVRDCAYWLISQTDVALDVGM